MPLTLLLWQKLHCKPDLCASYGSFSAQADCTESHICSVKGNKSMMMEWIDVLAISRSCSNKMILLHFVMSGLHLPAFTFPTGTPRVNRLMRYAYRVCVTIIPSSSNDVQPAPALSTSHAVTPGHLLARDTIEELVCWHLKMGMATFASSVN